VQMFSHCLLVEEVGTGDLLLNLQLSASTQAEVTAAGNIFFQDASIQIHDTTGN